ncbi:MAG: zinc-binding dehydrogenase [Armatimonadetes bacterium]|nr:zinc-binding dehydrogenase [Armatimonadota bacterium]
MKAVRYHDPGGPEVLKYEEAPKPEVSDREVLINVRACSLNRIDIWLRSGLYKTKLPHIPGSEFAGDVAEVGGAVTNVKVGSKVLIYPGIFDRTCEYCLLGEENQCENFGIIGAATDGGYAEYAKVPSENVFPIPDGLSYAEAAAIPLVFVTAWHMLITRAGLKVGETVLIQAASSGIGSAAVQIAKLAGATVIATAGSDEKLEKARKLGADYLINYTKKDFASEVAGITGGVGAHVVFEHTGAATFKGSLSSLKKNGRLVIAGATTGAEAEIDIRQLYSRQLSIIGVMLGTRRELVEIIRLVGEGRLSLVIDRVMPLSDAAKAHELLMDRKQFGKIVLEP